MLPIPVGSSKLVPPESAAEREIPEEPTSPTSPPVSSHHLSPSDAGRPTSGHRRSSAGSNVSTLEDPPSDDEDSGDGAPSAGVGVDSETGPESFIRQSHCADWTWTASASAHFFVSTSTSGDACHMFNECKQTGSRLKCVACRIICHKNCLDGVVDAYPCRQTFREDVRKYREQANVEHHWVQRRNLKGKCKKCGKGFPSKLAFGSSREIVGFNCSWCKLSYHNKEACRKAKDDDKVCDLGANSKLIVPPTWIVKLPRKGSFKSSLKSSPNKRKMQQQQRQDSMLGSSDQMKAFCIKPIPSNISPLLVFLNPKSGGNQGAKLMQKFQWLLNPRQVFDLTSGGPMPAIEMFKKVPNVKLLACGGDGTVGWLLSVLDKVKVEPSPPVSVLPLGTGNDLSRSLGWGGGYIDEPITKILSSLQAADEVLMDRWHLKVTRNKEFPGAEKGHDDLPLNVVNNYFSLGVDAQIALQFHEAREANPQKFNSRIRNKMFYGQAGTKDLLLRKWKDLSDDIRVECDGEDVTPKLKEHRVHSVLFANIPSFGSGTKPWDPAKGDQRIDDKKIEVIGLTTYQLPMLQAGSHGTCITQCRSAKIWTNRIIPMQVDGEAVRLNPAIIELSFLNQVRMLAKRKGEPNQKSHDNDTEIPIKLKVNGISMKDYERYHYEKDKLQEAARYLGEIDTRTTAVLDHVKDKIQSLLDKKDAEWTYVDSVTAIRFFRIDKAQENLHYVVDISDERGLYIVMDETDNLGEDADIGDVIAKTSSTPILTQTEDREHEEAQSSGQGSSAGLLPADNTTNEDNSGWAASLQAGPSPKAVLEKTTEGVLKAARLGDINMLEGLHRAGYSLLSIDETGKTALHYGARFGHKEVVKYLLKNAPASIVDMIDNEKGQTALHKAAAYQRRTICCYLVAAGADLLLEDHSGMVPRQLAESGDDTELIGYLLKQETFQRQGGQQEEGFETPV